MGGAIESAFYCCETSFGGDFSITPPIGTLQNRRFKLSKLYNFVIMRQGHVYFTSKLITSRPLGLYNNFLPIELAFLAFNF